MHILSFHFWFYKFLLGQFLLPLTYFIGLYCILIFFHHLICSEFFQLILIWLLLQFISYLMHLCFYFWFCFLDLFSSIFAIFFCISLYFFCYLFPFHFCIHFIFSLMWYLLQEVGNHNFWGHRHNYVFSFQCVLKYLEK